ncbi:L-glutamate gamma-semialdehyde dehydrogenase [Candidatus Chloroploca sp. M-50]|uniref:L-glutamate gamma-semialdehyde dehydrogenase n=2 Tax=Candidatus Chloroploca TaxID=1579476 RepID=A0A2H3KWX4_9CHLR|nr:MULTISPECIES: L-glutamate gamma-semialdehyde dehydrogenase [Candidatus Chloroploca]MBP1464107.1 L-glutamate gamma-semialdehyde dehydrogenase [Candidatus Chloroploca mongolica]PDV98455.1 L-glutamate gamma-semialdehyde dehydrogenase [Candidatus Chloroploca asiatica]
MLPEYQNEPFGDFSSSERRAMMQRALRTVAGQFGTTYPLIIGGERILTEDKIASLNPSEPKTVVGYASKASAEHAVKAIEAATAAFATWRKVPVEARARVLLRASALMRRHKEELGAWLVYEVSKSWGEADADVAEAIDFIEYYARQALKLQGTEQPLYPWAGENNTLKYIPLGVGVAIPPWNFALAITTGLVVAPIVAGNTMVLKPASATPIIAAKLVEILEEAGLPPGVLNYVPGSGGEIGDLLVDHPQTRFVNFTGSKEVGLRIHERASVRQPGQIWIKRTVLEMGGKDGIIVDETANLEAAADAIVGSAFSFQGQKCSACSRAIIVADVYDTMVTRIVERTKAVKLGNPTQPDTFMGAVIDRAAFDKISSYIAIGQEEGRLVAGGEVVDHELLEDGGYFINPTVFADIAPDARLAQEEIFGPVLAIIKARDFDHAMEIANNTEYGLTGAIFSRDIARIERAYDEFHVGNLYINRKCTGALVGVQPFGGFNMSGTDSKAGGPDYVALFTQAKLISEKL